MIRIYLIPPEILQARRDESRWKSVWLGGGIATLVVVLFWAVLFLQVGTATTEVASIQQDAASLTAQTSRFDVFKQKEADLRVRQDAVDSATAGAIDWDKLLTELGLVLPNDVYLTTFTGVDNAASGVTGNSVITLAGQARFDPEESPALGYKSIAKMLVRLTEMKQLDNVWLTSATKNPDTETEAGNYLWAVTANITPAPTQTASAGN